jgi:hypothetical protein
MKILKIKGVRLLPLAALALVAALMLAKATLALFVAQPPPATNSLTLGKVDIEVIETGFVQNAVIEVDEVIAKAPQVKNNSSVPVWVRVTVAGLENYDYSAGNTPFTPSSINSGWTEDSAGSGVFYLDTPLDPNGTKSNAIFNYVKLNNAKGGLNIIVYAEAVQADWIGTEGTGYAGSAQAAFAKLG